MGLNFKQWLLERLSGDCRQITNSELSEEDFIGIYADLYVRELAFWTCTNFIAGIINKCEFKTFYRGQETKGEEYYLWNIKPNRNQSGNTFKEKLISQLFRYNEALVIEEGGQLLVADSFTIKPYVLYDDVFSQVQVGDFTFQKSFARSDVLYFQLHEKNMRCIVNGIYSAYQKLIEYGMRSYQKSRGMKGVLSLDTISAGDAKFQETYDALRNKGFKSFADAENAVLPLWKGMNYTDLGSKTYSNEGTRDIRAMIDDVSDFTAKAFGISPALLRGDVQGVSDAVDFTLAFGVDPLVKTLETEINRQETSKEEYFKGTRLQIDTRHIKHVDLLAASSAIDKLISSGAYCINDVRKLTGDSIINEPWAWQHFITKNYASVNDVLNALQVNR